MPHWIAEAFGRYGYVALFIGVFLENLGIPVPGETVLLAAGFFARQHLLRLALVIPCAMVAAILGDNFGYWIGRRGGRVFVERHGKYVGLTAKRLSSVENYFHDHGPKTIFFARFISGIRVLAAISAGLTHVPWSVFFWYNVAGAVAWSTTIGLLGYFFGQSWHLLEHWVGHAGLVIVALLAVAVLFAVLRRHRDRIGGWASEWLPGTLTLQEGWLLAISLVAIGLLGKITEDVVTRESTVFDDAVMQSISGLSFPGVRGVMLVMNALGSGPAVVGATLIGIVWWWRRGDRDRVLVLTTLAIVTQIIDAVFKMALHRVRPEPLHAVTRLYVASFPSGHAMNVLAMYGLLAVLIARDHPKLRRALLIFVAALAVGVGVARVYLGLHWPTDVLAGYCAGLLLLSIAVFWLERLQ